MKAKNKLRLLYIYRILDEETDENQYLTTKQIMDLLKEKYGLSVYRMTVSSDIDLMIKAGIDIQCTHSTQNRYHLVSRPFELDIPEPKMLIDAVISAKFITAKKSKELISRITALSGEKHAEELKRNLYIDENYKTENEQVYLIADAINEAIGKKKKIEFQMTEYNPKKERVLHNNGEKYTFSPYSLVWDGEFYYVVGKSDKYGRTTSNRIDRILERPKILDEDAAEPPADLDLSEFTHTMFRMFNTDREKVELICENSTMNTIVDRFGRNVETFPVDETHFGVTPTIAVNHIFYSWIFGFGGKVTIRGPEKVKEGYIAMINNELERINQIYSK